MSKLAAQGEEQKLLCRLQVWAQNLHEEMDADKETVLLCHHGVRSMRGAGFLASQVALGTPRLFSGPDYTPCAFLAACLAHARRLVIALSLGVSVTACTGLCQISVNLSGQSGR